MAKELISKNRHVFVRETPDPQLQAQPKKTAPTKQQAAKQKTEAKPKAETKRRVVAAVPDDQLLDLTEDNVLALIKRLGGKDVTSKMMVPYLKVVKEKAPQKRYPPTVRIAKKLVKAGKLKMANHQRFEEFRFSLP